MALSAKQKKFLKGKAHALKPVVMLGKEGLSEGVVKAMYHALRSHELVKIRLSASDQKEFQSGVKEILTYCDGAEKVQTIGHNLIIFRPSTPAGKVSKALAAAKIPYTKAQREARQDEDQTEEE